jgi:hypothetical protein
MSDVPLAVTPPRAGAADAAEAQAASESLGQYPSHPTRNLNAGCLDLYEIVSLAIHQRS